jgi:hypothetical protein
MSNSLTPEIAALYGAIDSNAAYNGSAVDAHLLRTMAMSANRLAAKGHQVFRSAWDSTQDPLDGSYAEIGNVRAFGPMTWKPIIRPHTPVFKKPGIAAYDAAIVAFVLTTNDQVSFQIATRAAPLQPALSVNASNVIRAVGNGTWRALLLSGTIPADRGTTDEISLYARGLPTNRAGDTTAGGAPNTGTVSTIGPQMGVAYGSIVDNTATWHIDSSVTTTTNTWFTLGSYVSFSYGGTVIAGPYQIIRVPNATTIVFYPGFTPDEQQRIDSAGGATAVTYSIFQLPRFRICDFVLHGTDRTT